MIVRRGRDDPRDTGENSVPDEEQFKKAELAHVRVAFGRGQAETEPAPDVPDQAW